MVAQISIFGRAIEFLASQPVDEDIINFKATDEEEERVDYLSARKQQGTISADEAEELHNSLLVEYMMGTAKVKAFSRMEKRGK